MIASCHDKDIDMLKLGCTLPNVANICSHKSTDAKFYPFTEGDKYLLEKIRGDIVGGPSVVFTRKAVVDETFVRKSANICKSIVGIDASQLHPHSMCQPIPTGLYTHWGFDSETSRFTPRQKRPATLKTWSCLISNEQDQNVKLKASLQQADRRKMTASVLMGFVLIATLCLKPWVAFTTSAPVKRCVLFSLKRIFTVVARRESSMHRDDTINKKKVSRFFKCGSANSGDCTKHPILLNNISENNFLTDVHLQLNNF